jgi:hypothetical protein
MSDDGDGISKEQRRAQRYLDQLATRADTLRELSTPNSSSPSERKYRRRPEDVVDLVNNWSRANDDASNNDNIQLFVSLYEEDVAAQTAARAKDGDNDEEEEEPPLGLTPQKMKVYMELLDRIFFFNILRRRVPIVNKAMEDMELVELRTYNTPSFGKSVDWNMSQMLISVRTQVYELVEQNKEEREENDDEEEKEEVYQAWNRDIDEIMCDLIEAMCLAYLDLFCNHSSPQYQEEVMPGKGFGQGWRYWELLGFVMSRVADWLPDSLNKSFMQKVDESTDRGIVMHTPGCQ